MIVRALVLLPNCPYGPTLSSLKVRVLQSLHEAMGSPDREVRHLSQLRVDVTRRPPPGGQHLPLTRVPRTLTAVPATTSV